MTGTFLTEAQWKVVGRNMQGKSVRELIIDKDIYGNAVVRLIGPNGVEIKNLRGNVIQFPIKNTPKKAKGIELFNRFVAAAKNVGVEIGFTLGLIEELEGDEDDGDLS